MRATFLAVAFAISVSLAAPYPTPSTPMGGWASSGNLSTKRPGPPLIALLTDGRVMVSGATGDDYTGLGNVDLYDPARGWSLGPHLDADPIGAVLTALPNGSALLAGGTPWRGGFDGPGPSPVATAMTYEPSTNTWIQAPNMSTPRFGATATAMADGRVLVVGGYDRMVKQLPNQDNTPFCCIEIDIIPQASAQIFDPRTRRWSPAGMLADARFGQAAVALKGGQVLVVGGDRNENPATHLGSAEIFDPTTGGWSSAGTIGDPRTGFSLTTLADGRALLAGGLASDGVTVLRTTLLYDPAKRAWSAGPDLRDARTDPAAATLSDGRVLIAGGVDYLGRLAAAEILDPTASTSIVAGALATARSDAAAVTLQDGRVLVAGGRGAGGPLQDSEIFDPKVPGTPPASRTDVGPGRWLARPAQPISTYAQTLSLLRDGRVLVLPTGGYPDFAAQVYDPKAGTWVTAITRRTNQNFISAVALADDRVLLLVLASDGQSPGKAEIVDLATGVSIPAPSPGMLGAARLDRIPDGRVWLTGGVVGDKRSFFFDPVANKWSSGPDVPSDLYVGTVTALPDGRILVGGITQAMVLDPAPGTWTHVATFPVRWSNYSATSLPGGDVLFAGGMEDVTQADGRVTSVATARVMRYHHDTRMLRPVASLPAPRAFQSATLLTDGRVLFAGGITGDSQSDPVATAELYDPIADRWSTAMSMPEARSQASAVTLEDGTVVEVGGYGVFNPPPTLHYYSPRSSAPSTPVASDAGQPQRVALIAGLVVFVLGGLVSTLLIVSARRR